LIQSFRVPVRDNSVFSSFRRQQIGFCARALDKDGCHEILQFGSSGGHAQRRIDRHNGRNQTPACIAGQNVDLGYRIYGVSRRGEEGCASLRS
jgi:hypothetical protein